VVAAYSVWILVSVWRCADNVRTRPLDQDPEFWSTLARWSTVAWALNVLFVGGFVLLTVVG
jgi:hypothetical protein